MIQGVIQNNEVLRNSWTIYRSFGLRIYLRCLHALWDGKRHTFLELLRL